MVSKKRLPYVVVAVTVVVIMATALTVLLTAQAPAPQSLARRMVMDSSNPSVSDWRDFTPPSWKNMTEKNSYIDYVANCEHVQVHGYVIVWNSTSEAVANFHSWNLTANYHNLTVGEESSIDTFEYGGYQMVEIYFIRGNVTAWLRCQIYPAADLNAGIEESLMLALAQDMKVLEVQAEIGQ